MLKEFIVQNYLIVQNNVVTNIVLWDGDTSKWTPPQGSIALIQTTTTASVWRINEAQTDFELVDVLGAGDIGFTWDGTILTTNQPKPAIPA